MKTDLTTIGAFNQSRALLKKEASKEIPKSELSGRTETSKPDYTLELSSVKKPLASIDKSPIELSPPDLPDQVKKGVESAMKDEVKKEIKVRSVPPVRDGSIKSPAIFFIKGLDLFSSPLTSEDGDAGVGKMAESVEGARIYGHDQKEEMIREIKKVHKDFPVVLVGHSLGGDTAVEIASEFDSLEHKFRPIDLLVTIDAVGFNNDIIPQNVKKHLNIFGEKSWPLNDGPHVARREELTSVRNILSPLDHTDLDDDKELQFEVIKTIQETLSSPS